MIDKSSYLKGLLIIAKKDNKLSDSEKKILRGIADKLGFASDFYEETIQSILYNKYLEENPIKFSDKKIAESFITDGLKLAFSDKQIDEDEIKWLKETAKENQIDPKWFESRLKSFNDASRLISGNDFALFSII